MNQLQFNNEEILEDVNIDDIFINADRHFKEENIMFDIMMELFGERKAIIQEEEFAEYELVSTELHN